MLTKRKKKLCLNERSKFCNAYEKIYSLDLKMNMQRSNNISFEISWFSFVFFFFNFYLIICVWYTLHQGCTCVGWLVCWIGWWQTVVYKSSSSSGNAVSWASCKSFSICNCHSLSIFTSGGNRAGIATNSKFGSPTNLRANHKNGFSKL